MRSHQPSSGGRPSKKPGNHRGASSSARGSRAAFKPRFGHRSESQPSRDGFRRGAPSRSGRPGARGERVFHKPRTALKKPATSSWGHVANWYNEALEENPDTYQSQVILPNLFRLLEPLSEKRIIEIGCGQGFFSRAIAERGATVEGYDIAPELIEFAKAKKTPHTHFAVAPADDLSPASSDSFDVALIILALQNIKNLDGTIAEAARVLKQQGQLIIVLNHPSFRIPKSSSWLWDDADKSQIRRVDRYMGEREIPIDMHPGSRMHNQATLSYHRPLQAYVKALAKYGFSLTGLEEWVSHKQSQPGPRSAAEDTARKEFPLFMMLQASRN